MADLVRRHGLIGSCPSSFRVVGGFVLLAGCGADALANYHLALDPLVLPGHKPLTIDGRAGITVRDAGGIDLFDLGPVGSELMFDRSPPLDAAYVGLVFDVNDGGNKVIDRALAFGEAGPFTLALGEASVNATFVFGAVGGIGDLGNLDDNTAGLRGAGVTLPDGSTWLFGGSKSLYSGRSHSAVQRLGNLDDGDWAWEIVADLPDFDGDGQPDEVVDATATAIDDEGIVRILFAGGRQSHADPTQNSGWAGIFDPTEATWVWTSETLDNSRSDHLAIPFEDGNVLLYGGVRGAGIVDNATWEVFDVPSRTFLHGEGKNDQSSVGIAAALLGESGALVCGGGNFVPGGAGEQQTEPESYCQIVSQGGNLKDAAALPEARQLLALASLGDGRVLACGGSGDIANETEAAAASGSAWVFDPEIGAAGQWTAVGDLLTPRMQHRAVPMPDGRALIIGGVAGGGWVAPSLDTPIACDEIFDPATGQFTEAEPCHDAGSGANPVVAWHAAHGAVMIEGASESDGGGTLTGFAPFPPPR